MGGGIEAEETPILMWGDSQKWLAVRHNSLEGGAEDSVDNMGYYHLRGGNGSTARWLPLMYVYLHS